MALKGPNADRMGFLESLGHGVDRLLQKFGTLDEQVEDFAKSASERMRGAMGAKVDFEARLARKEQLQETARQKTIERQASQIVKATRDYERKEARKARAEEKQDLRQIRKEIGYGVIGKSMSAGSSLWGASKSAAALAARGGSFLASKAQGFLASRKAAGEDVQGAVEEAQKAAQEAIARKQPSEEEKQGGLIGRLLFGRAGAKGLGSIAKNLATRAIGNMGLPSLAAGVSMIGSHGIVGGGLHAAGSGILNMLTSGYKVTMANTNAMLGLGRNIGADNARYAYGYSGGLGYNPRERARLGGMFGRQAGYLNKESMNAMMYADSMGVSGEFASMMGNLTRADATGANQQQRQRASMQILGEVYATALVSKIEKGRIGEMFKGLAALAGTVPLGFTADRKAMQAMMASLGRADRTLLGTGGHRTMMALQKFVTGGGGALSDVASMMGAGFGKGKDIFGARELRQGGLFSSEGGGGLKRLRETFEAAKQMVPHQGLRLDILSQETGLPVRAVRMIEKVLQDKKLSPEAMQKEIADIQQQEKPLRVRAYEAMAKFGGFKNVEIRLERLHDTLGRIIAPTMLKVFSTLLDIAENTLMQYMTTIATLPKGTAGKLWKKQGLGGVLAYGLAKGAAMFGIPGGNAALEGAVGVAHGTDEMLRYQNRVREAKSHYETSRAYLKQLGDIGSGKSLTLPTGKEAEKKKTSFNIQIHMRQDGRQFVIDGIREGETIDKAGNPMLTPYSGLARG